MDNQSLFSKILFKIGLAIVAIALLDLVYINYLVLQQNQKLAAAGVESQRLVVIEPPATPTPVASGSPAPTILPTSAPLTIVKEEKVIEKQTVVQTAQKEIFIPIGSSSTFNSSYTDLAGLEITIDTTKYSAISTVDFEASIWVQDGNGKMYAQLYNKSDGRPVWNSEIATSSGSGVLTVSSPISLENGARTYRVQAKTNLTAYAAHVENARIKITLR